jgi:RNA polymerase sigma factor (sigma-70 family)
MCTKDCEHILKSTPSEVVEGFKNASSFFVEKIIGCIYGCYQKVFVGWACVAYNKFGTDKIYFISNTAFTDGLLKFTEDAKANKLYNSNAKLKTVLHSYFNMTLLGLLQTENRLTDKEDKYKKDTGIANAFLENEALLYSEQKYKALEIALNKMEPMDKQIIVWRQIEEKTPDEIATVLGISKEAASNRIYRCMLRLKILIEKPTTN